jgi:glycosyltransferase
MKISLITPSYNSAKTIGRTVASVARQNYSDLEYLIIDGASTDGTKEAVLANAGQLSVRFLSAPDQGIYDAMNKGVRQATGEVIGILNSDDLFAHDQVLSAVAAAFADEAVEAVYGDIRYFSTDPQQATRYWPSGEYDPKKLAGGWTIPHPALFLRKSVYDKYGLFDTSFRLAGDYEFILRLLKSGALHLKYLPQVLVLMSDGGASSASWRQRVAGWRELRRAWRTNGLKTPPFFITRRVLSKVGQYFRRDVNSQK